MAAVPSLLAALARPSTLGDDGTSGLPSFQSSAGDIIGRVAGGQTTQDALQGAFSDASASTQAAVSAELDQQTSDDATAQRRATGAAAAVDLASHGIDWDSEADKDKVVAVYAAIASYVNPALGVAVEALYQVGKVIAQPVIDFFGKIFGYPPGAGYECFSKGAPMTPQNLLGLWQLPHYDAHAFGQLARSALALNATSAWNCKASTPPQNVVAGMAALWNAHATGSPVDLFVPALASYSLGPVALDYGSQPFAGVMPFVDRRQAPYAFLPVDQVPISVRTSLDADGSFFRAISTRQATPAAVLHLNGDVFQPQKVVVIQLPLHGNAGNGGDTASGPTSSPAASSEPSTAGNVARVAGVAAVVGVAAWVALGGRVGDVVSWARRTF
ncbi:MAG: hypothetical protein ACREU5_11310 [Burkholderiales bacterium]